MSDREKQRGFTRLQMEVMSVAIHTKEGDNQVREGTGRELTGCKENRG